MAIGALGTGIGACPVRTDEGERAVRDALDACRAPRGRSGDGVGRAAPGISEARRAAVDPVLDVMGVAADENCRPGTGSVLLGVSARAGLTVGRCGSASDVQHFALGDHGASRLGGVAGKATRRATEIPRAVINLWRADGRHREGAWSCRCGHTRSSVDVRRPPGSDHRRSRGPDPQRARSRPASSTSAGRWPASPRLQDCPHSPITLPSAMPVITGRFGSPLRDARHSGVSRPRICAVPSSSSMASWRRRWRASASAAVVIVHPPPGADQSLDMRGRPSPCAKVRDRPLRLRVLATASRCRALA